MRVLIVDDDANVRSSLRRLLMLKYRAMVSEAADGSMALHFLLQSQVDLVLLDLYMPGMNGIDTLRAIRRSQKHNDTPVMMLTGTTEETVVGEVLDLGVLDYLVKPIEASVLFERIASALTRSGRAHLLPQTAVRRAG